MQSTVICKHAEPRQPSPAPLGLGGTASSVTYKHPQILKAPSDNPDPDQPPQKKKKQRKQASIRKSSHGFRQRRFISRIVRIASAVCFSSFVTRIVPLAQKLVKGTFVKLGEHGRGECHVERVSTQERGCLNFRVEGILGSKGPRAVDFLFA